MPVNNYISQRPITFDRNEGIPAAETGTSPFQRLGARLWGTYSLWFGTVRFHAEIEQQLENVWGQSIFGCCVFMNG